MYLFILGRQPEISLAELRAVFGNAEQVLPQVALVATDVAPNIDYLGSVRKVGQVIYDADGNPGEFLLKKFQELPEGKITLGISHYGKTASTANARKTGVFFKKNLKRSVRILPNTEAEISDAATLGNRLGTSSNKIELLMAYVGHRLIIAELTGVQNLNAYTLRDRGRPKRDARVGMLPPKLAQTMINLAIGNHTIDNEVFAKLFSKDSTPSDGKTYIPDDANRFVLQDGSAGRPANDNSTQREFRKTGFSKPSAAELSLGDVLATEGSLEKTVSQEPVKTRLGSPIKSANDKPTKTLLDPFCGTGVILQEAALMNFKVYGTDLEPRMIDFSQTNLDWLEKKFHREIPYLLKIGDVTSYQWQQPIDFVATETYLGRPYSAIPTIENLRDNIQNCELILTKFLRNLHKQITKQTGLCVAVPCWFVGGRTYHLPLVKKLAELGYEQISFSEKNQPLIYHREDQIVGRELLILKKK